MKYINPIIKKLQGECGHLFFNSLDLWGADIETQKQNLFDTGAEDYEDHVELFFAYQCLTDIEEQLRFEIAGPYVAKDLIKELMPLYFEICDKIAELEN